MSVEYTGYVNVNGNSLEALQGLLDGHLTVRSKPFDSASKFHVTIRISEVGETKEGEVA